MAIFQENFNASAGAETQNRPGEGGAAMGWNPTAQGKKNRGPKVGVSGGAGDSKTRVLRNSLGPPKCRAGNSHAGSTNWNFFQGDLSSTRGTSHLGKARVFLCWGFRPTDLCPPAGRERPPSCPPSAALVPRGGCAFNATVVRLVDLHLAEGWAHVWRTVSLALLTGSVRWILDGWAACLRGACAFLDEICVFFSYFVFFVLQINKHYKYFFLHFELDCF